MTDRLVARYFTREELEDLLWAWQEAGGARERYWSLQTYLAEAVEEARLLEQVPESELLSITCPRCRKRSWHPQDVAHGYCGFCHDHTTDASRRG